ncbi:TatD family hydrolase [Pseudomonas syringae pv. actinidiae ICMP 19096]|uniref:TatD family hydrolase n=1 Tax=Pseudomonas syringae pv. actinidiae ICMP 19096 TaxID=1194405 RepID=A0A656JZN9_PSESF|nr:TatD family hydrolase [Pseudomonas syringae pv. actinidiae ICMP 19096]
MLHCFTEDWEMAKAALDMGYYISLSGIVTFRNADALRDVARQVPADRLLVKWLSFWRCCVAKAMSVSPNRPPPTSPGCSRWRTFSADCPTAAESQAKKTRILGG